MNNPMNQSTTIKIAAAILSLTILGTTSHGENKEIKKGLKIAFVPKNINNPYNVIETGIWVIAMIDSFRRDRT